MDLADMESPPDGGSWVDYATSHQHVQTPCWQCIARKKALAELEEQKARADEAEARLADIVKWLDRERSKSASTKGCLELVVEFARDIATGIGSYDR
jgi:hypothetical protein